MWQCEWHLVVVLLELLQQAHLDSVRLVEELLPEQQEKFIAAMEDAGVTVTYPDQQPFIEATQGVREKLGMGIWGEEAYRRIAEIGAKDL